MSFIEENLLGLIVMLVVAVGLAFWVLRASPPGHTPVERPRADAPPPLAPLPIEPPAAPAPVASPLVPTGPPDNLLRMKGVGPKLVTTLNGLGVTRYDQIAAWSDADIDRIDAQLGSFKGRPRRDLWVEQAKFLAAGDTKGFEGKFGKL